MSRPKDRDRAVWVSPQEAADLLGLTRETVYRMVSRGDLAGKYFGRVLRIPRAAVVPEQASA
jgi:excisionase family DNA binding protein